MAKNKNIKEASTPANALTFDILILSWWGIYPAYGEKSGTDRLLYYTKGAITFVISISFTISIWLNIFFNMDDTSVVIETLYFGLTQTTFLCKLFNLHIRSGSYKNLVAYLALPMFNSYSDDQNRFMLDAIYKSQIFSRMFRGAVSVTIVFFCVFPFLDNGLLPLPSYFPVPIEDHRYVFFIYQMVGIIINGYCHSTMDIIVITLITIGSAQFEILKDNLTNFRRGLDEDIAKKEAHDRICAKRLKADVLHHVTIIEYAYHIESVYSFVQFVQFLASSIIICVTGFQIIVTPITDLKFITLALYFACNLIQVTMCCWFGHDIMTKSEGIGEACYMSDWYNSGSSICRTLFIIMERSKRPVTLTAGKFFDLTLQTLMQVLKTSYSYLALLRRMNEVREGE